MQFSYKIREQILENIFQVLGERAIINRKNVAHKERNKMGHVLVNIVTNHFY